MLYEKLTWPEVNAAIRDQKIPVITIGAIEQHGPHLPLDVDIVCPWGVVQHACKNLTDDVLTLSPLPLGYTAHVMDFPGTLNVHYEHMIQTVLDYCKSLAYHGFKKMIIVNGHGSNAPVLDITARRVNLETDAECVFLNWWSLLTVDKDFLHGWRESITPGGCAHGGELETSVYLYLDESNVRKEYIQDELMGAGHQESDFFWVDLFGAGAASLNTWTSSYTESGIVGLAKLATIEKGEAALNEASHQFQRLVKEFKNRPPHQRTPKQIEQPSMPMPWNQSNPTGCHHV